MKRILLLASAALMTISCSSMAIAQVTPESIKYAENVMATTKPVVYQCTRATGQKYYQYRYYINATDFISNYEADTVSCRKY